MIAETGSGTKLLMISASAEALPTVTWLGSIKKNTAAAIMAVPIVIMENSLIDCLKSMDITSFPNGIF